MVGSADTRTASGRGQLAEVLRVGGYRVTRPRTAVWEVMLETGGHLTADEISDRVQEHAPGVNLASVYRALALLGELDLVRESRLGDSDASTWEIAHPEDDHFHLVCEACGRVDHHAGDLVDEVREHLRRSHRFDVSAVELVVRGRCEDCRLARR